MKRTGTARLVSRGMKVLQAAPTAYPYRQAWPVSLIAEFLEKEDLGKISNLIPQRCNECTRR